MRSRLTAKPIVPVLIRAAAVLGCGGAVLFSAGCSDDAAPDTSTTATMTNTTDQAPTAGPCAHDPSSPECETGGDGDGDPGDGDPGDGDPGDGDPGDGDGDGTDTGTDTGTTA